MIMATALCWECGIPELVLLLALTLFRIWRSIGVLQFIVKSDHQHDLFMKDTSPDQQKLKYQPNL